MADDSLENAKALQRKTGGTKNAVTCFDRTIDWSDFRELLDVRERLQELTRGMSHGYVYGLLNLVDLAESVSSHPENALWRSRFYYRTWRRWRVSEGSVGDERRRRMEVLAQEIVQGGIERFGGDYRIAFVRPPVSKRR